MWNKPDPAYVPQYAAFYLLLGDEYVDQQRAWYSVFRLVESWGASVRPLTPPYIPLTDGRGDEVYLLTSLCRSSSSTWSSR